MTTRAPTYFVLEKKCCTQLRLVASCGIIEETESRSVKGGCVDKYVVNSRGGCRRTQTPPGNSQADVAHRGHARKQVWGRMAHRPGRTRRVEEATQKSIQETGSGKLINEPVFSVALRTRLLIGTHQAKPVSQRYRMSIIATNHHELQRFVVCCRASMGYEVAVRREGIPR